MNSLTELLKAIAELFGWPIVFVIVVIVLRKKVGSLLDRVSRVKSKYGEAEFQTKKEVDEAEETAKDVVEASAVMDGSEAKALGSGSMIEPEPSFVSLVNDGRIIHTKEYRSLREVARFSPRAAVVGAWSQVESAVDLLAKAAKKVGMKRPLGDVVAFEILKEMEIVSTDMAELYDKLRGVWVKATSDSDFAMEEYDAERYLSVTLRLVARLIELKEKIRRS